MRRSTFSEAPAPHRRNKPVTRMCLVLWTRYQYLTQGTGPRSAYARNNIANRSVGTSLPTATQSRMAIRKSYKHYSRCSAERVSIKDGADTEVARRMGQESANPRQLCRPSHQGTQHIEERVGGGITRLTGGRRRVIADSHRVRRYSGFLFFLIFFLLSSALTGIGGV
ncbi:hypothetical protein F4679DRAFT_192289 [Xylaria curta]|nr:hypothetical protein F4679DRAFT_192289 [Xylaria curta]